MQTRLTLFSALEVVAFAGALILYLKRISTKLMATGGAGDSYLAKISFGVSAIAKETSVIGPGVGELNQSLTALGGKVGVVAADIHTVATALAARKESGQ